MTTLYNRIAQLEAINAELLAACEELVHRMEMAKQDNRWFDSLDELAVQEGKAAIAKTKEEKHDH